MSKTITITKSADGLIAIETPDEPMTADEALGLLEYAKLRSRVLTIQQWEDDAKASSKTPTKRKNNQPRAAAKRSKTS